MELLAVVAILGTISSLIVPRLSGGMELAKNCCCYHNAAQINAAVERFYLTYGGWPDQKLEKMRESPDFFPQGLPDCPVTGATYYLNEKSHRVEGHTEKEGHKI